MFLGLLISGISAYVTATNLEIFQIVYSLIFLFIIIELGLVITISWAINKLSPTVASILFIIYSILTGMTLSGILLIYTGASITLVFFLTASIFAIMSIIGFVTEIDLSKAGVILFVGLIGLIIAMIVNFFLQSPVLYYIISVIGVIIFIGLIMYDTQLLKKMALFGRKQFAILGALKLYLDFVNLFLFLLRLFGKRK
jgi:FtsH-binding integral membrane protein